jgi:UDP-2-acetamido-2-deoxy-ribo-hexuluronate aminotransferase
MGFLHLRTEFTLTKTIEFTGLEMQRQRLRPLLDTNIARVLDHGQFIMGPEVGQLERELANFSGAQHAIALANGTDALQIALMAAGVGYGHAVLLPSFTYTATAEAILILGAAPIFVEVDPVTFNLDPLSLKSAISVAKKTGKNIKAIIGVDLFGLPADWVALNAIADENKLFLIADAAQSFGAATASGRKVGTLAPITTASFFPAKPLGCYGDGGAVFTDNAELASVMRSIRVHGQGKEKYETVRVGMNSRLDTIQAAILLAKLTVFAEEIVNRNILADRYTSLLHSVVQTPVKPAGVVSAWAQYTIKVGNRDAVQKRLKEHGIPTAVYYPKPMHLQSAYAMYGGGENAMPISEALSASVLSLPMNPYWTESDLSAVCDAVQNAIT